MLPFIASNECLFEHTLRNTFWAHIRCKSGVIVWNWCSKAYFKALWQIKIYQNYWGTANKSITSMTGKHICSDVQGYMQNAHDDVIKWKHFPRYWSFVQGIHRSLVNSPHKGIVLFHHLFFDLFLVAWPSVILELKYRAAQCICKTLGKLRTVIGEQGLWGMFEGISQLYAYQRLDCIPEYHVLIIKHAIPSWLSRIEYKHQTKQFALTLNRGGRRCV